MTWIKFWLKLWNTREQGEGGLRIRQTAEGIHCFLDGASDPVLESLDSANRSGSADPAGSADKRAQSFQCGAIAHGIRSGPSKGN